MATMIETSKTQPTGVRRPHSSLLAGAALLALAGCGPSEADINAARDALTAFVNEIDWSKYHGYYTADQIRYIDLRNTPSDRPARFAILLLQEDEDPRKPRDPAPEKIATFSESFYVREFCPPQAVIDQMGEDFSVTLQILSKQYGRYQTIFCRQ